jgi:hypothetical protein
VPGFSLFVPDNIGICQLDKAAFVEEFINPTDVLNKQLEQHRVTNVSGRDNEQFRRFAA